MNYCEVDCPLKIIHLYCSVFLNYSGNFGFFFVGVTRRFGPFPLLPLPCIRQSYNDGNNITSIYKELKAPVEPYNPNEKQN